MNSECKFKPNERKMVIDNILHHIFKKIELRKHFTIATVCEKYFWKDGFRYKGTCYLINPTDQKVLLGRLPLLLEEHGQDWEQFLKHYELAIHHRKKAESVLAGILGRLPDAYSTFLFFPESLRGFLGINESKMKENGLEPMLKPEEIQKLQEQFKEQVLFIESILIMQSVIS